MNIKRTHQFIVTIVGSWLDGDKEVTAAQVTADVRQAVKGQFQFLAKRTSVKRIPLTPAPVLTLAEVWAAIDGNPEHLPTDRQEVLDTLRIIAQASDECDDKHGALDHEQQTAGIWKAPS